MDLVASNVIVSCSVGMRRGFVLRDGSNLNGLVIREMETIVSRAIVAHVRYHPKIQSSAEKAPLL